MEKGIAALGAWPQYVCLLAKAYLEAGHIDNGINIVTEMLAGAGSHDHDAELYRLKGELLLKQGDSNAEEAQSCFERAIEIARASSAKSWELRATMSLARLLRDTGRRDEARMMLADIYGWFTEGFDTADLVDAKALLKELGG
jgi:predicted ATPase